MADKSETRLALEARAIDLGVTFQTSIGDAKLRKRVEAAQAELDASTAVKATSVFSSGSVLSGPDPQTQPASDLVVEVIGPKEGRRRAGRSFGPEPVNIPLDDLSESDKEALIGDPVLSVRTFALPY